MGGHVLRAWSSTQAVVALSSGEAEYYALIKGASLALGMRSLAADMGIFMAIDLFSDSSAARGVASRRGLGGIRTTMASLWARQAHKLGVSRRMWRGRATCRRRRSRRTCVWC